MSHGLPFLTALLDTILRASFQPQAPSRAPRGRTSMPRSRCVSVVSVVLAFVFCFFGEVGLVRALGACRGQSFHIDAAYPAWPSAPQMLPGSASCMRRPERCGTDCDCVATDFVAIILHGGQGAGIISPSAPPLPSERMSMSPGHHVNPAKPQSHEPMSPHATAKSPKTPKTPKSSKKTFVLFFLLHFPPSSGRSSCQAGLHRAWCTLGAGGGGRVTMMYCAVFASLSGTLPGITCVRRCL